MSDQLNNSRYVNGAMMRRDVTADYVEQYLQMRFKRAQGQLLEGLQFCLPFWNIRVSGSQYATEALLMGLERENTAAPDYLEAHAVAQRGQVYAQIVPTAQDSVILISRIAHGASYYWHAEDEVYFREYSQALTSKNFFLHLRNDWSTLPEPTPEPHKYERRVFALGLAYEFIALRGSAYYLDLQRQYSLAGTTRHTTADWRTIPLLSAVPPSDEAQQPANPNKTDLIGDGSRWEIMQKFVEDEQMASSVREKLQELFNQRGREAMREELRRYCREMLEAAIGELEEDDLARLQLEAELADIQQVIEELKRVTGNLLLAR